MKALKKFAYPFENRSVRYTNGVRVNRFVKHLSKPAFVLRETQVSLVAVAYHSRSTFNGFGDSIARSPEQVVTG